jgi:hypothetical protein
MGTNSTRYFLTPPFLIARDLAYLMSRFILFRLPYISTTVGIAYLVDPFFEKVYEGD